MEKQSQTVSDSKPEEVKSVFYKADQAVCKGDISIGDNSSIWYNSVIRADSAPIEIGCESNIQDGCILHVDPDFPLKIRDRVTIGHGAILHGCQIDDEVLVGMGAIVMNGAKINRHCLLGAGTLIPEGKIIEEGSLVMGVPGKVIRKLTDEEIQSILDNADHYVHKAREEFPASEHI